MMPIRFIKHYTREYIRQHPEEYFVFGDNDRGMGLGGQAKEARGEPNAIGIRTKWAPGTQEQDYFHDDEPDAGLALSIIKTDFNIVKEKLDEGKIIWFPQAGVGSGLSKLKEKAPKLHRYIYCEVVRLYHLYRDHHAVPELDL